MGDLVRTASVAAVLVVLVGVMACRRIGAGDKPPVGDSHPVDSPADSLVDSADSDPGESAVDSWSGETGDSSYGQDLDDDGYPVPDDCDDSDPEVNPGADEICDNGVDDDCDGRSNGCRPEGQLGLAQADLQVMGLAGLGGIYAGDPVGDMDGDGAADMLAYAPLDQRGTREPQGSAYLIHDLGSYSGVQDLGIASVNFAGPDTSMLGTRARGMQDTNGDGVRDLVIPHCAEGKPLCILHGPHEGEVELDASWDGMIVGPSGSYLTLSAPVLDSGDADGDGLGDLLIGQPAASSYSGAVMLIAGPLTGSMSTEDARTTLYGDEGGTYESTQAGWSVALVDVDGDGLLDMLFGAPEQEVPSGGDREGAVFGFLGSPAGWLDSSDADLALYGKDSLDYCGVVVAPGDSDGDGYEDLWIGAPGADIAADNDGVAYMVPGGAYVGGLDTSAASVASASVRGDAEDSALELAPRIGDVDADGHAELALISDGRAYLFYGPLDSGTQAASEANAVLSGESADNAVYAVHGPGDVNGDGYDDIAASLERWEDGGANLGSFYVVFGGSY